MYASSVEGPQFSGVTYRSRRLLSISGTQFEDGSYQERDALRRPLIVFKRNQWNSE